MASEPASQQARAQLFRLFFLPPLATGAGGRARTQKSAHAAGPARPTVERAARKSLGAGGIRWTRSYCNPFCSRASIVKDLLARVPDRAPAQVSATEAAGQFLRRANTKCDRFAENSRTQGDCLRPARSDARLANAKSMRPPARIRRHPRILSAPAPLERRRPGRLRRRTHAAIATRASHYTRIAARTWTRKHNRSLGATIFARRNRPVRLLGPLLVAQITRVALRPARLRQFGLPGHPGAPLKEFLSFKLAS